MTQITGQAVFLESYPSGAPRLESFVLKDYETPKLRDDEVLLRTIWMSVDPYMRGRMNPDVKSYVPPFKLEEPLDGGAVSQVIESTAENLKAGDYVVSFQGGWKQYHVAKSKLVTKINSSHPGLSMFLGVLGMPGMTAWAGLTQVLEAQAAQTLFVSGAAGAVGSLVCQLGKQRGLRVIGSAGTDEKCRWLRDEVGCTETINYKSFPDVKKLTSILRESAPNGIDCYFENVGGIHLEAALNCMADNGRIALCGLIANYNEELPLPGPPNLVNLISKNVSMRGFLVSSYSHLHKEFLRDLEPLLASNEIQAKETIYDGLALAPEAFIGLFNGDNIGKSIIRVGPDEI